MPDVKNVLHFCVVVLVAFAVLGMAWQVRSAELARIQALRVQDLCPCWGKAMCVQQGSLNLSYFWASGEPLPWASEKKEGGRPVGD